MKTVVALIAVLSLTISSFIPSSAAPGNRTAISSVRRNPPAGKSVIWSHVPGQPDAAATAQYGLDGDGSLVRGPLTRAQLARIQIKPCIKTAREFAEEFLASTPGRPTRCVEDLIGRINSANSVGQADLWTANSITGRDERRVAFASGPDGIAAYLNFGQVQDAIGDWINGGDFADPQFPGLQFISNGQGLLQNVRFTYSADISQVYQLIVFKTPKIQETPTIVNTWKDGLTFVQWTLRNVCVPDEDGSGRRCGVIFPKSIVRQIAEHSYIELTNCSTTCIYANDGFPETTPVPSTQIPRDENGLCRSPPTLRPSTFENNDANCFPAWRTAYTKYAALSGNFNAINELFVKDFPNTPLELQALELRAYLIVGASYDPITTGTGYQASGFGGVFNPLRTEVVLENIKPPRDAVRLNFCVNGLAPEPCGVDPAPPCPSGVQAGDFVCRWPLP